MEAMNQKRENKVVHIMNETIEMIVEFRAEIKKLEKEKKIYEAKLKSFMEKAGIKILEVEKYRAIYQDVATPTFDKGQLKEDFPEIYKAYEGETVAPRLNINVIS